MTVCVKDMKCCLGEVVKSESRLSPIGKMVNKWWRKIPEKFLVTSLDEYILVPNHIHGIIWIANNDVGTDQRVRPILEGAHTGAPVQKKVKLGDVVQWFKTMSTNEYIRNVKGKNWLRFNKRFWQRNYYEHIIRNDEDLNEIREYIRNNPLKWEEDKLNPTVGVIHELPLRVKTIYVFGNPDVVEDNAAIKIAKKLEGKIKNLEFVYIKPNEDLPFVNNTVGADQCVRPDPIIIMDVVEGTEEVKVLEITCRGDPLGRPFKGRVNDSPLRWVPRGSVHDYDLGFQLQYLQKLGKLGMVRLIGIPMRKGNWVVQVADLLTYGLK